MARSYPAPGRPFQPLPSFQYLLIAANISYIQYYLPLENWAEYVVQGSKSLSGFFLGGHNCGSCAQGSDATQQVDENLDRVSIQHSHQKLGGCPHASATAHQMAGQEEAINLSEVGSKSSQQKGNIEGLVHRILETMEVVNNNCMLQASLQKAKQNGLDRGSKVQQKVPLVNVRALYPHTPAWTANVKYLCTGPAEVCRHVSRCTATCWGGIAW